MQIGVTEQVERRKMQMLEGFMLMMTRWPGEYSSSSRFHSGITEGVTESGKSLETL